MWRAALILLFLRTVPAGAQVLRGTVVEEISGQPVAGGLVQLLAGLDTVLGNAATTEWGRFDLPAARAGQFRLRVLRIGFHAWDSGPFSLAPGQALDTTFVVPSVPVVLADITVEAESPCRGSPVEDRRMALLWDEARKTIGLSDAARRESVEFRTLLISRVVDPANRVREQHSRTTVGAGRWPVTSQAPDSLATLGYIQPDDTLAGPIYFGPDAAVFFSDAFLRSHCFRLRPPPKREPGLLGLGFEPVKGRRVIDISGVLWLNRATGALVRLEYRYPAIWDWVPRDGAGGTLSFARLSSGQVVITGWKIRAPVALVDRSAVGKAVPSGATRRFFGLGTVRLHGYREEEGAVQEIRTPNGRLLWRREPRTRLPDKSTLR